MINLTPEMREQLRMTLLRELRANPTHFGLAARLILTLARASAGLPNLTVADVEAELSYLQDKGLAEPVEKLVSPELRAWRITAAGRDFLAEQSGE